MPGSDTAAAPAPAPGALPSFQGWDLPAAKAAKKEI